MTKIWLMSDLHIDNLYNQPAFVPGETPAGTDVIVVAGDICEDFENGWYWLLVNLVSRQIPVIFAPGNHDYYGNTLQDRTREFRNAAARDGVHLLIAGESVVIAGTRFVGGTLWTDYCVADDIFSSKAWAKTYMPDFACILGEDGWDPIPRHFEDLHKRHLTGICDVLHDDFDGPTVVVTHHAPHAKSLRDGRVTDVSDASFASDLTKVIERWQPAAWLHGHVHVARDYVVAGTRIVANPRGYGDENPSFDPSLVVEVGS